MTSRKRPLVTFLLKAGIASVLLGLMAWIADPREVVATISHAHWGWLAASLALAIGNRILMGLKWTLLIRALNLPVSWTTSVKAYFAASFAGIFLPPTIGADAIRTLILSKAYSNAPKIISSIIVERLIGLTVLALFAFTGVAVVVQLYSEIIPLSGTTGLIIAGSAAALGLGSWFLTTPRFSVVVNRVVLMIGSRGGRWRKVGAFLQETHESLALYRGKPVVLAGFFMLTCLENLIAIVRAWFVALALGASVGLVFFFVITPIEQFVSRLPISLDGFGLREGLFMYALLMVGVPAATGLAIGLANHLLFIIAILPGIWFLMANRDLWSKNKHASS